jgi:hypothetical protein
VTQIPAELRWLSWAVQPHWPDGDEAALRRCAQDWRDAAGALRAQLPDADRAGGRALAALGGPTADAARAAWDTYTVGDAGHVEVLAIACTDLADLCDGTAGVIEDVKRLLVGTLVRLAEELAVLAALAEVTAGLSLIAMAEAGAAARGRAHDIGVRATGAIGLAVQRCPAAGRLAELRRALPAPDAAPDPAPHHYDHDLPADPGSIGRPGGPDRSPPGAIPSGPGGHDGSPANGSRHPGVPGSGGVPALSGVPASGAVLPPASGGPPSAPGPSVPGPSVPGPSVPGPSVPGSPASGVPGSGAPILGAPVPGQPGPVGGVGRGSVVPGSPAAPGSPGSPGAPGPTRDAVPAPGSPAAPPGGPSPGAPSPGTPSPGTPSPDAQAPGGQAPAVPAPGGSGRPAVVGGDRLAVLAPDRSDGTPGLLFGPRARPRRQAPARPEPIDELIEELLAGAAAAEARLTPVLEAVAEAVGGALLGLEHRLKPAESVRRKLAEELADCPDSTAAEVLGRMKDAVRYTVGLAGDDGVELVREALLDAGYEHVRSHFWRDGDGLFEVRVHTPESYAARERQARPRRDTAGSR